MGSRSVLWLSLVIVFGATGFADESLRERLKDSHVDQTDVWVYNDIASAMAEARKQNKPLVVTFRCVPCKDCSAFDADVANGNDRVRALAKEKFVAVRQVEMKGVDLSLFQFDHDLNWAGMFINADGVVYARYGTQSSEGSDAYNSIDGLLNTMHRVLDLHAHYPANRDELKGKRGEPKPVNSAVDLPGLRNRSRYAETTTRKNCIHCHNIHDAEHQSALDLGQYSSEMLWKYPLPENIGLTIDRKSGIQITKVTVDSASARAEIRPGEEIVRMNGQPITSIADMQWVLHHLSGKETSVDVETKESGKHTVKLAAGWKQIDFSWRGSMWNAPPRFQVWAPVLPVDARKAIGLNESNVALEVRWINRDSTGGQQVINDGLKEKDVIIAVAGQPLKFDTRQFNAHIKRYYQVGDILPLTVLRNGQREELKLHLVE